MGTHATAKLTDSAGNIYACIYFQYDGHTLGFRMKEYFKKFNVVNGFQNRNEKNVANGIGCLYAQFIRDFKNGVGNFYLESEKSLDEEEYNYIVTFNNGEIHINCNGEPLTFEEDSLSADENENDAVVVE
jgi:hypothetical protein